MALLPLLHTYMLINSVTLFWLLSNLKTPFFSFQAEQFNFLLPLPFLSRLAWARSPYSLYSPKKATVSSFRRSCFFPGKEFISPRTQEKLITIHFCLLDSDFIFCYSGRHCFLRLRDSTLHRKLTSRNIRLISQKCDERIFQCLGVNFFNFIFFLFYIGI